MRLLWVLFFAVISGCSSVPYEKLDLDTTSDFTLPSENFAGVYVYQWKTGIVGAASDVDFEIIGKKNIKVSTNTGEYAYFELPQGVYKYKFSGGMIPQFYDIKIEAGKNYFFRSFLLNFSDNSLIVRDQKEIDSAKSKIKSGYYEYYGED